MTAQANPVPSANIARALIAAQSSVERPGLDGENTYDRYRYASVNEIFRVSREALCKSGLALLEVNVEHLPPDARSEFGTLRITRWIVHSESGDTWQTVQEYPIGKGGKNRPADKQHAASLSGARKFYVLGLLLLDRGDPRDEPDTSERSRDVAKDDTPKDRRGVPPAVFAEVLMNAPSAADIRDDEKAGRKYLARNGRKLGQTQADALAALVWARFNIAHGKGAEEGMRPPHVSALARANGVLSGALSDEIAAAEADAADEDNAQHAANAEPDDASKPERLAARERLETSWSLLRAEAGNLPDLPPPSALRDALGRADATWENLTTIELDALADSFDAEREKLEGEAHADTYSEESEATP